jgi:hypothetical protein
MKTVASLKIYGVHGEDKDSVLIVSWRKYENARWNGNGFWRFPLPVALNEVYERAYVELAADEVYLQPNLLDFYDAGLTYS